MFDRHLWDVKNIMMLSVAHKQLIAQMLIICSPNDALILFHIPQTLCSTLAIRM